jgi:hypothetical protein
LSSFVQTLFTNAFTTGEFESSGNALYNFRLSLLGRLLVRHAGLNGDSGQYNAAAR